VTRPCDDYFRVKSWSATFRKGRGETRVLEVWKPGNKDSLPHDVSIHVSAAGRVRVYALVAGRYRRLR